MTLSDHLDDAIVGCEEAKMKVVGRVLTWQEDQIAYPVLLLHSGTKREQ